MKKCVTCPDYMTIPMDDPSMLDMQTPCYGEELAVAFVHRQPEGCAMYSVCEGFAKGSVYQALDKPYVGCCCKPGGDTRG